MIIPRDNNTLPRRERVAAQIAIDLQAMGHQLLPNPGNHNSLLLLHTIDGIRTFFNIAIGSRYHGREETLRIKFGKGSLRYGDIKQFPEPKAGFDTKKIATALSEYVKKKKEEQETNRKHQEAIEVIRAQAEELRQICKSHKCVSVRATTYSSPMSIEIEIEHTDPEIMRRILERIKSVLDVEEIITRPKGT